MVGSAEKYEYSNRAFHHRSGCIQILDAFGDGTRIPLIAVSPFARKGAVDHAYTDHVSILIFIEAN